MTKYEKETEFKKICLLEPRLLETEVRMKKLVKNSLPFIRLGAVFCANRWWYGYDDPDSSFRHDVHTLVGWNREDKPELSADGVFDTVHSYLFNLLPDCNHEDTCCRYEYDAGILGENEEVFPLRNDG